MHLAQVAALLLLSVAGTGCSGPTMGNEAPILSHMTEADCFGLSQAGIGPTAHLLERPNRFNCSH